MAACEGTPESRLAALEGLCSAYWPAVFVYIRRRGKDEEEARDLTQEFFASLLEKNWLATVDQDQGRFRAFLLTLVKRFLADEHDYATRKKRGGGVPLLSLDWTNAPEVPDSQDSPELAFDRRWALTVVSRAGDRLKAEVEASGRGDLFSVLAPFVAEEPESGAYDAASGVLGMSRAAISMAVHRLRLRLRALVRAEVAETLSDPAAVDGEMQELIAALRA